MCFLDSSYVLSRCPEARVCREALIPIEDHLQDIHLARYYRGSSLDIRSCLVCLLQDIGLT